MAELSHFVDTNEKIPHGFVMSQLAEKHAEIADLIQRQPIHYVDVPFHENIGDLLIMKGTIEFFKKYSIATKTKSAFFNFPLSSVMPREIVVFHGGGNFGDLYRGPQQIRERTIERLRDNRVIILPQTIHFSTKEAYDRCCDLMSRHNDLHICVRDRVSYELARNMTTHVYLLPDMAHQLWPLTQLRKPSKKTLGLIRSDGESRNLGAVKADDITDWPELVGRRSTVFPLLQKCMRLLHLLAIDKNVVTLEMNLWIRYADRLVEEAIELFSVYDQVITDRLHGHILSCLMMKPNVILDNSYGKNSQYHNTWTLQSDIVGLDATTHLKS